jgi:hypothetical protein
MWQYGMVTVFFLFSLITGTEGAYSTDSQGFIRDWLVAGPFPNEPETTKPLGYDADYLAGIGGESEARPYAGLVIQDVVFRADKGKLVAKVGATNAWGFTEDKTIDVTWKEIHNKDASPVMNLNSLHKDFADYYVSYLAAYVECSDEREVQVKIGSDDGFKLWVNGKLSGEFVGCRSTTIDDNIAKAHFSKGMNKILLKVMDLTGDSGGVVRITDDKGKPAAGLKVYLELPEHQFRVQCKNIGRVDMVEGKVFGTILLGDFPYFAGENVLDVRLGCQEAVEANVAIRIKGPDGKTAWEQTSTAGLKLEDAWLFKKPVSLVSAGRYDVTVTVTTPQGTTLGTLTKGFDLVDFAQLKVQNKGLREKIHSQKDQITRLTAHLQKIQSALKQKKAVVAQGYERMAQKYAEERSKLIVQYGPSAKSINEPFIPAGGLRTTLCINGDQWEIAAAKSTGRSRVDESYIPTTGWEPITVPTFGIEYYFRNRRWPVKGGNTQYAPARDAINKEAACGFMPNEGRENNAMYLRTHFTLPENWSGKRLLICTDRAEYKIKIWLNDKLVSEALYGWMIPLQVDLTKYVKPGVNTLMVYAGRAWLYGEGQTDETWGLQGDVYLKSVPPVYVEDAWVIPHWRTATLETRTRITNMTGQVQKVSLNQKAILNGRIRKDFGDTVVEIPSNTTIEVKQEKPWADPECWDVGKPVLYQLASTLSQNGKSIDQHFQRFGYREFWKSKFDYWLNGKRFFVQGDVADNLPSPTRQYFTLFFTLLRNTSNINTVRAHVDHPQSLYATVCDELGMFFIPNMYPSLDGLPKEIGPNDVENFKKTKWHELNVRRYTGWVKWLRNHPSVVIYSTDNEVFTQAWPKPWDDDIRNDRIAALYEPLVKSLDPSRLVTRDGDQGTWGKMGAWQQQPPADVANYHYPEFDNIHCVHNWQSVYKKPVLYGETLYCSYGAWDNWIGAKPSQVITSAGRARTFLSLYRDLDISGWVGMGIGHNGFIENKPGGTPFDAMPNPKPAEVNTWYAQGKMWPGMRLRWPSQSGPGFKQDFGTSSNGCYGNTAINWYLPGYPACVLNEVNKTYKENTRLMPEAPKTRAPEVIYQVIKNSIPLSGAMVFLTPANGQGTEPIGVRCDKEGKAWFVLPEPGEYLLSVEGTTFQQKVKIDPLPNDLKPGLNYMPHVKIEING